MSSILDIYLSEYKQLKDEQRARIIARDYLLYVMLTVVAAVSFFAFRQSPVQCWAMLLLPPAGFVLGWTYLINDWKVSELGHFFRNDLTALITKHVQSADLPLYWETVHRQCVRRGRRKIIQTIVNLATFCVPSLVALSMFVTLSTSLSLLFVVVLVIEFLAILSLTIEFVRSVDKEKVD